MKKAIITSILLLTFGFSFSQVNFIDSLKTALKSIQEDTVKCEKLLLISDAYSIKNTDSALHYLTLTENICKKNLLLHDTATALYTSYIYILYNTQSRFGLIYNNIGNFSKAREYWLKSSGGWEKLNLKKQLSEELNNIGETYVWQGEAKLALKYFEKSLVIKTEINDQNGIASCYNNIAFIYQNTGEIPKALDFYNKCLLIKEELKDLRGVSSCLNNIGSCSELQGDYLKALEYYNRSLKLKESFGDKKGIARMLNNIAIIYQNYGDPNCEDPERHNCIVAGRNLALDLHFKCLDMRKEINDQQGISYSYNNIGSIYDNRKDFSEALNYYYKSLKVKESLKDKYGIVVTLYNIGLVKYEQKKYEEARELALQSLQLSKEMNYVDDIRNSNFLLAKTDLKLNKLEESMANHLEILSLNNKNIANNFPILSEKEKELYFKTMAVFYDSYYSTALQYKTKDPSITVSVYNSVIKNKGLLLRSSTAMRQSILAGKDSALIKNYNNWTKLKKELAITYREGKENKLLEEKANQLEKELVKNSQIFGEYTKEGLLTWIDIKNNLRNNEAAIEFINFGSENIKDSLEQMIYCAIIIKANSKYPEMISLCSEKDLLNLLQKNSGNHHDQVNALYVKKDVAETGAYEMIWQPLEPYLKNIKSVYVSPSGLLHKISFSALSKKKGTCLSDEYELNMVSNTSKVAMPESFIFNSNVNTALYGGIDYNSDSSHREIWKYLEGTKKETENIYQILKQNNIEVNYVHGKNASEEHFKTNAPLASLIHVASHGFFYPDPNTEFKSAIITNSAVSDKKEKENNINFRGGVTGFGLWSFVQNKNPLMRSGLVLAGANDVWSRQNKDQKEDGVLTAAEVANIDLRKTKLVVLSACETGLGDIKGSEGVYGLQRSFKMAGVKHIIMSLWQVPDKETSEFMVSFYKKLAESKNIKTAFAQTQNEMRKKYDPYFWAAFVLLQ